MSANGNFKFILLSFSTLLLLVAGGFVFAANFSASVDQNSLVVFNTLTLNFSINNTDGSANITQVNVTFPDSNFSFTADSNATTASNTNFSNTTSSSIATLTWSNSTATGFVENGTTQYFSFRVKLTKVEGSYSFNVSTLDTSKASNSSLVNVTVSGILSTSDEFSAVPSSLDFNWTDGELNITSNENDTRVNISNQNNSIAPVYFVISDYGPNAYSSFNSTNRPRCFTDGMEIDLLNTTGQSASNTTGVLNETNASAFITQSLPFCPPGLYAGQLSLQNFSNSSENISIPTTINILISENNTFLATGTTANFTGSNISGGSHSYYFYTNMSQNITGVTINITGLSNDVDLFLIGPSGNLMEKSINTGNSNEELFRSLPATAELWEIRLANVSSSYVGHLYFTTLNLTNISGSSISSLAFGTMIPNQSNSSQQFTLTNVDDQAITGVNQTAEVYHTEKFLNFNSSRQFNIIVPNFTTKLKIRLEWSNESGNVTDWDLSLRDNNGNLISSSTTKSSNANSTDIIREEFVEFSGSFTSSNEGLWNITVTNKTNSTLNLYNVTALVFFNDSQWTSTTFNEMTTFDSTGSVNDSYNITANITVPRFNVLNGSYEGSFTYTSNSKWKLVVPFSFDINAGTLTINNSLKNTTFMEKDNIGYTKTIPLNITFNNTGGFPIYYTDTTSSLTLFFDSTHFINFTIDDLPPNPINPGVNGTIDLSLSVNTSHTSNQAGIYKGWIFFNTTNSTLTSSSYPYDTFNLSIELNLSNLLNATIVQLNPSIINNSGNDTNITLVTEVRLQNGTIISKAGVMGISNFTSATMTENNVTTYSVTLTDINKTSAGVSTCEEGTADGFCDINVTVPSNVVGGTYTVALGVKWFTGSANLTGTATNATLVVNKTGLNLTAVTSTPLSVGDDATATFNLSVTNFGPVTATGIINASSGNVNVSTVSSNLVASGCGGKSGVYFNIDIAPNGTETCWYTFTISPVNVTGNKSTTISITADDVGFGNLTVDLTVTDEDTGSTGNNNPGGGTNNDGTDGTTQTTSLAISSFNSSISITLGETASTSVVVENTGDTSLIAMLNVTIDGGINSTLNISDCGLGISDECAFGVNFSVSNDTDIGDHTGSYLAYKSTNSSVTDSKSFTITVLPSEEKKVELNLSYEEYALIVANLTMEFERIKSIGFVSEANLSRVEALLNESNGFLDQIKNAINNDDYITAASVLRELNSTINRVREALQGLETEQRVATKDFLSIYGIWIAIAIVIVAAGVLMYYTLLPPKSGYHVKYGYKTKKEKGGLTKIKSVFGGKKGPGKKEKFVPSKAKEDYLQGYEKIPSDFTYKRKESVGKRIKNVFKRRKKQKDLSDFPGHGAS